MYVYCIYIYGQKISNTIFILQCVITLRPCVYAMHSEMLNHASNNRNNMNQAHIYSVYE